MNVLKVKHWNIRPRSHNLWRRLLAKKFFQKRASKKALSWTLRMKSVFIVNFDHIRHIIWVSLLFALTWELPAGKTVIKNGFTFLFELSWLKNNYVRLCAKQSLNTTSLSFAVNKWLLILIIFWSVYAIHKTFSIFFTSLKRSILVLNYPAILNIRG